MAEDLVCIVTGPTSGIGKEIAKELARRGAQGKQAIDTLTNFKSGDLQTRIIFLRMAITVRTETTFIKIEYRVFCSDPGMPEHGQGRPSLQRNSSRG
jgi:NADP-dependent 3-hydroxy acid dehydrogenase YdfG